MWLDSCKKDKCFLYEQKKKLKTNREGNPFHFRDFFEERPNDAVGGLIHLAISHKSWDNDLVRVGDYAPILEGAGNMKL
jgi:hypothetical protein